jgi:CRP-like cAMP-binding protein
MQGPPDPRSMMAELRVLFVNNSDANGWSGMWAVPPMFSSESDALCLSIAQNFKKRILNRGEYMCRAGDDAHSLYFVNRGAFSVQLQDIQFELLGPGACFGEIGFFLTDSRTMDIVALEDNCEVLELFVADYNSIIGQYPDFALRTQERLWEIGNMRMQKLQKACKRFTKRADDPHPTALVLSSAVKAMKDLEKKRRVRIWHELYDREGLEQRRQTLMLTLPAGSKLRSSMRTLADAERIIENTFAAAIELSGLNANAAAVLASCEWLDDSPKAAVAELIARARLIAARSAAPTRPRVAAARAQRAPAPARRCGDVLLSADEPVSSIFIMADGAARVFGRLAGREVTSALVPRGGCFGLAGLVPCTRSLPPPPLRRRRPSLPARACAAI